MKTNRRKCVKNVMNIALSCLSINELNEIDSDVQLNNTQPKTKISSFNNHYPSPLVQFMIDTSMVIRATQQHNEAIFLYEKRVSSRNHHATQMRIF